MFGLPDTFLQLTFVEELIGTYRWVWSLSEVVHFIGLILLVGIVTILDLRMLGVAKRMTFAPKPSVVERLPVSSTLSQSFVLPPSFR